MEITKSTLSTVAFCLILASCASPKVSNKTTAFSAPKPVAKYEYPYRTGLIWQNKKLEPSQVGATYNKCKKIQAESYKRSNSPLIISGAGIAGALVGGAISGLAKGQANEIALLNLRRCMSFSGFTTVGLSPRMVAELDAMPVEERNDRIELMMAGKI